MLSEMMAIAEHHHENFTKYWHPFECILFGTTIFMLLMTLHNLGYLHIICQKQLDVLFSKLFILEFELQSLSV